MDLHIGYIMTVSNSIIGVSILAMPYCFKQCGIILAILMLLASGVVSRLTCHYLLKSAMISRRRTFELLSFHTFGSMGKLFVELGIIGFLMGTCVAYFVIIGDLGPAIIAKTLEIENNDSLRMTLLICLAMFCVVPLGLLKNVDSLNSVSIATIGFYFCLVLKTMSESANHLASDDLFSKVELWKPHGVLQCFPIFAMALSCQTQLFEIYETLPNASLEKMNYVVRSAVNICVCVYILVGFFGYVAFVNYPFTGNILMSFNPSLMTDAMKIGFILSVACSFPLVIFPCRASLYSLLFRKGYMHAYEGSSNFIPENRFKLLTLFIVGVSLIIGILIPNIEVVLGLLGSTIGIMICVIFPVTCFICISVKNTNERILAQILLFVGIIMMVMGTYANLYAMEEINTSPAHLDRIQIPPIVNAIEPKPIINKMKDKYVIDIKKGKILKDTDPLKTIVDLITIKSLDTEKLKEPLESNVEIRKEPPQPVEPEEPIIKEKEPPSVKIDEKILLENKAIYPPENSNININKEPKIGNPKPDDTKSTKTNDQSIDKAAIEKEEKEIKEEGIKNKIDEPEKNKNENADDILKTLEKHKEEQKSLIQAQKELLEEIKKETKELKDKHLSDIQKDNELRAKAANQIVEIAKKAIESLGPNEDTIKNAEKIIESLGTKVEKSQNNTLPKAAVKPEKINADVKKEIDTELKPENVENQPLPKEKNDQNLSEAPKLNNKENIPPLPILMNLRENGKKTDNNFKSTDNLNAPIVDKVDKLNNLKSQNEIFKNENDGLKPNFGNPIPPEKLRESKYSEVKEIPLVDNIVADKIVPKIDEPILQKDLPTKDVKSPDAKTEKVGEKIGRDILQEHENDKIEKSTEMHKHSETINNPALPLQTNNTSKIGRDLLESHYEKDLGEYERRKRDVSQKPLIDKESNTVQKENVYNDFKSSGDDSTGNKNVARNIESKTGINIVTKQDDAPKLETVVKNEKDNSKIENVKEFAFPNRRSDNIDEKAFKINEKEKNCQKVKKERNVLLDNLMGKESPEIKDEIYNSKMLDALKFGLIRDHNENLRRK